MDELLQQQLENVPITKTPKPVEPAISVGINYNAQLQRIVRAIKKDIEENLIPVVEANESSYTKDGWVDIIQTALNRLKDRWFSSTFRTKALTIASVFVTSADKVNRRKFNSQMKTFGLDIYGDSPELVTYLEASVADNVQLISSIPQRYIAQVESLVLTNMRAGNRPDSIAKALVEQYGVERNRAKFIARDQSAKLAGQLNERRQTASGFVYFKWLTSKDGRVRDRHSKIANTVTKYGKGVYRWDDPPLSDDGIPIIPGGDYQCRCTAIPYTKRQVDANK